MRARRLILPAAAAAAIGGYLLASSLMGGPGFPLDDAWIHQTYARSLAENGAWMFNPGQPSAGSTAPLWTLLLAVGHVLDIAPLAWAYFLGWACLWVLGELGQRFVRLSQPGRENLALAGGLLLIFDWRMAWASASGMESLLLAATALGVLGSLWMPRPPWLGLGGLVGLSAWVRPDGVTLLAPLLLGAWLLPPGEGRPDGAGALTRGERVWARVRRSRPAWLATLAGCGALFGAYLVFNRMLAGAWWPNTFFAKQAEYAVLRQAPLWLRLAQQAETALVGVGAVLLPGFLLRIAKGSRQREWPVLLAGAWFTGYLALYAWRLPVTYQHARYLIPALPVYLVIGLTGLGAWRPALAQGRVRWVVSRSWQASAAGVLLIFYLVGGQAYAGDVAVIESEMVAAAHWVARCTPSQARIAAHDIGALGYFGERRLVDLAGLITPEVIPFMTDEARLLTYLEEQQVDYLVTFPGWYPRLAQAGEAIFVTQGRASPAAGGENMVVYRWGRGGPLYKPVGSALCRK